MSGIVVAPWESLRKSAFAVFCEATVEILLATDGLDADKKKLIRQIGTAGERAASLTRQLLAFSRKQIPRILNLNALVADQEKMLRRLIGEDITLVAVLHPRLRPVKADPGHQPVRLQADPTRLAQVFLNLLNNAAKYTDRGGRISLTAERQGDKVVVRVRDNGIGIPPEMLPRVFDLFAQVDRSMERSEGGLGIGLTLVQRLVEMHGGAVEARSDGSGKGSEFVVRLPVAGEVTATRLVKGAGAVSSAPPALRILVVDDNRDAANSLGVLLRMMGNEVHTAHDGLEAVGAAAAFQPDVIILDIGLPKLSGYEAARRIREQEGGADVLLVALTGWGQEEDVRRSHEAGFDHHMTKPVEFDVLKELLMEAKRGHAKNRPTGGGT